MSKLALQQIDWFKSRGFLLGRDRAKDIYYIVEGATGIRYDFGSVWQAQQFVNKLN